MTEETLFAEALARPVPSEREAFLDEACKGDPELRARVEELLRSHEQETGFLREPAVLQIAPDPAGREGQGADRRPAEAATQVITADGPAPPISPDLVATIAPEDTGEAPFRNGHPAPGPRPIAEGPGSRIGPYKLLQRIGEGGMGAVYMAEQERPVRRKVALKIIKPGMDSEQVVARFEAERQALAMMDHPSIARVFDAGTTETGRPFFVMELVNGTPITEYCDEARLSTPERLELFAAVCQAIQHAHQKGIIHRDIKPSNVLVTLIDGKPLPKVIDFGIAKAIDQRLTEKTMFTQFGAIVGTLEYMSPEQAELSGLDVDTRSDIYALGVLLYELLTGTTPMERSQLREAGYIEILRRIIEEEPPKPSLRLSGSGERLSTIAAQRGTEPGRLTRVVRGDLDWIVMKALDKSRTRRYETATGFAGDVQRYLAGDPVEACPPSAAYRLRKFARKHRAGIATVAAFGLILLGAAIVSGYLAVRANSAAKAARDAEDLARSRMLEIVEANAKTTRALEASTLARKDAEAALVESKEAGKRAAAARDQAEATLYVNQINLAHQHWLADNVQQADRLLEACPKPLRNWEWSYLGRTFHPERLILPGNGQFTSNLAFSRDGKRIAAFSNNGISGAVIWDIATRNPLARITSYDAGSRRYFVAGDLSPDGVTVAMGERSGIISLWDASTGKLLRDLGKVEESVGSIAFSPDGRRIAAARTDRRNGSPLLPFTAAARNERLSVIEVASGKIVFSPPAGIGVGAAFSPDGKHLLAFKKNPARRLTPGSPEYLMALWDTSNWKEERTLGEANSWSFTSDGRRVALGGRSAADGLPVLEIVEVATGREVVSLKPARAVGDIALDPDGKLLAVAVPFTPQFDIWDVAGKKVVRTLRGHTAQMNGIAMSPDGKTLATCAWDNTIKFWDPRADAEATLLPGRGARYASAAAIRPDGRQVAFVQGDNVVSLFGVSKEVTLWDPEAGKAAHVMYGHTDGARRVAYSADGKVLASGSRDETVRTWDVQSGRPLATFRGHKGYIEGLAVSPDGRWVASSHEPREATKLRRGEANSFKQSPGEVKVWGAHAAERRTLTGNAGPVYRTAFSPDGRLLASGDYDGMVKLWDAETGEPKGEIKASGGDGLTFSPDGRRLAVISGDAIILHDIASGTELVRLIGHGGGLFGGLAFSPDGKRAASARGREVKLWEIPSGREILTLPVLDEGKVQGIAALAFSPDGRRLLAAGRDGSVQAWDAAEVPRASTGTHAH